ncbi:hypothetical protein QEN19_003087 [Hanseniaspora menglaensis]
MSFNPDDYKFQVSVDENEDTEWNDILREHGIIPEKKEVEDAEVEEEIKDLLLESIKNKKLEEKLEELNLDEIDEDDFRGADSAFINNYRMKKLQEMKDLKEKQKNDEIFGNVQEINKPEYNMIIESSKYKDKFIAISLYSTNLQSKILLNSLGKLASGFPYIKFVQIKGETCIENYPVYMCPTIIIYKNNKIVKQMVSFKDLNGNDTNFEDLKEWIELECNAFYDNELSPESESDSEDNVYANRNKGFITGNNQSDSDSDFFD